MIQTTCGNLLGKSSSRSPRVIILTPTADLLLRLVIVDCSGEDGEEKNPNTTFSNMRSALLQLVEGSLVPKTIIFCNKVNPLSPIETCRKVENVLNRFDRKGSHIKILPFHAALAQEMHLANIREFLNSQLVDSMFLICTNSVVRESVMWLASAEKLLRVNMKINKLRETVKAHQQKTAGSQAFLRSLRKDATSCLQPLIISLLFQAKCICEAEEKYESLSKTLDPDLSLNYWRRCEEATKEGGLNSGHAYGTWTIPCVIADEDSFRAQSVNKKSRGS
uniref:Uncharacterized protein n=1 Tax=Ananas comosus var. bracteatus TaxID=296719 RepID=A0A6V7P5C8_ANACO|nr:unnamed protein product [Ananas comosus var. bracteatus]